MPGFPRQIIPGDVKILDWNKRKSSGMRKGIIKLQKISDVT